MRPIELAAVLALVGARECPDCGAIHRTPIFRRCAFCRRTRRHAAFESACAWGFE